MSKIHTKLGVIGQIVTVIGLAAGLAACDDPSTSASTAANTAGTSATAAAASSTSGTPTATTTPTTGESKSVSSDGSTSSASSEPQSITLAWDAPTENTDGSAITNLQGYEILYGTSASALTQKISISTTGQQNYVVENLSSGTWYFEVVAINAAGVQSGPSSLVSVTLS
jgi:hypothetical protein